MLFASNNYFCVILQKKKLQEKREEQVDKLIEILKTKNHWLGPLIDTLIRSGQATLAKELTAMSGTKISKST